MPGTCGSPRKFTALLNFATQVSKVLSQPATALNVSPAAMLFGMGSTSVNCVFENSLISMRRPAFAPVSHSTSPPEKYPAACVMEALMNTCLLVTVSTAPLAVNPARLTLQRPSPSTARQVGEYGRYVGIERLKASAIKYPHVHVQLTGKDGNAFMVLGLCQRAAQKAGLSKAESDEFFKEAQAGDYDHLLATCMKWFDVD